MSGQSLVEPIFFIGMPRSGTTILFEAFARHPELGWPSNYSKMFPARPCMNLIRRLHDNALWRVHSAKKQYGKTPPFNRFLVRPDEAYPFWDRVTGVDFSFDFLSDVRATQDKAEEVRRACVRILRRQGRKRFSAKLTGPPRVAYLLSVFPDAKFVHVVRDGRAVTHSLLRVPFWKEKGGFDGPFWKGGLTQAEVEQWKQSGADPGVITAMQWQRVLERIRAEGGHLPEERYLEVRYEEFVDAPHDVLGKAYAFAGLGDSKQAHDCIDQGPALKNMNHKYLKDWSPEYVRELTGVMASMLREYGYAD